MKSKNEIIRFFMIIFIFAAISLGFINKINNLKSKNEALKKENFKFINEAANLNNKISTLEDNLQKVNIEKYSQDTSTLAIDYMEVTDKVRFMEKDGAIHQLPQSASRVLRPISANTLVKVVMKASVNGEAWLFVQIPTYDSATNNRGWIKESESTPFTKDKIKLVKNIEIKAGSEYYETEEYNDIKNTTPKKFEMIDSGCLIEKKEGYCKVSQAGGVIVWVKESSIIYPEVK